MTISIASLSTSLILSAIATLILTIIYRDHHKRSQYQDCQYKINP
ncbi:MULTISPECIES: hypothetical protein [Planktothrix]|nr:MULTISPECIES: hypothetical protein [Planktothrix]